MRWSIPLILLSSFHAGHGLVPPTSQNILNQPQDVLNVPLKNKLDKVIAQSPLLTLHRWLCEIPSVSFNELAIGEALITFLEAHNFTVHAQEVPLHNAKKRLNLFASPDPTKFPGKKSSSRNNNGRSLSKIAQPKVLLSSHIDTVPPHLNYSLSLPSKGKDASRRDVLISGRGTVDDKACVAVQIQTVLDYLSDPEIDVDPSDLGLLFVVGEERFGDGMIYFSDSDLYQSMNPNLKAILFGEPTELKLAQGHKGIGGVHITARGKAAHSGYPWLGRSANSMIVPALMVLDVLGDLTEEEGGLPRSEQYGKSTVNLGLMEGGVAGNVVAEHAYAEVTWRLAGGTDEEAQAIIRNSLKGADPEGKLELEFTRGYGPVSLDYDVPGFESMIVNYGTDVINLDVAKGVKRYLYGPGTITVAHSAQEGLTVGDMEDAVDGYKRLLKHALEL